MNRDWARLRALPAETVMAAIGARQVGEHYACPRDFCGGLFVAFDDPACGVSVRCTREGCILSAWAWPEWCLALHWDIPLDEARRRLLEHVQHVDPQQTQQPRRTEQPPPRTTLKLLARLREQRRPRRQ